MKRPSFDKEIIYIKYRDFETYLILAVFFKLILKLKSTQTEFGIIPLENGTIIALEHFQINMF